jgi:hypothetical protein
MWSVETAISFFPSNGTNLPKKIMNEETHTKEKRQHTLTEERLH